MKRELLKAGSEISEEVEHSAVADAPAAESLKNAHTEYSGFHEEYVCRRGGSTESTCADESLQ